MPPIKSFSWCSRYRIDLALPAVAGPPPDPFLSTIATIATQTRTDFIAEEISETGADKVACTRLGDLVRGFIAAPGHDLVQRLQRR